MFKRRSSVLGIFAAAAAVVGATLGVVPAHADVLFVSDVAASISAPSSASGASFSVLGTITNAGTLNQPAGSTITISATGGSVTSAPGCAVSAGSAVCTVGALNQGQAVQVAAVVTPAPGATSVVSQAVVKAAQLESPFLDPTNNTATTSTSLVYGVDGSLTNNPTDVRNGDDVLLTATVSNTKAPQTVNAVIVSGGTIDTRIALPAGCSVTSGGANVSCSFALATGGSKTFDVAVATPTSGTSVTSTLNISGQSGGSKSVSTSTNLYSDAQAFVPEGDNLTYAGSNQNTTFNVPVGSTTGGGTFLYLRELTLDNTMCGTQRCIKQAAEAIFPSNGKYSGSDVNHPYVWEIQYNERQVCNGSPNGGSTCLIDVYWIPTGASLATAQRMPLCPTYSTTASAFIAHLNNVNEPCLQKVVKGNAGFSTYTVAVLRDIVIPIISGGKVS